MKNILIVLFLIINTHCYGQSMIVSQKMSKVYRSYRFDNPIKINSLSELPSLIQLNTNGYLKRLLGSMKDSIQFSHGQEIDLKGIFKKDSIIFYGDAIKPKYILNYKLADNTIGIKRYYLKLELDEYGQLLKVNWPRSKYNNTSKFLSREKIKQFALEQAKLRRLDMSSCKVYFQYNSRWDILCWRFQFTVLGPIKRNYSERTRKSYKVLLIASDELRIISEYQFTI